MFMFHKPLSFQDIKIDYSLLRQNDQNTLYNTNNWCVWQFKLEESLIIESLL